MQLSQEAVVPLLERDVSRTVGEAHVSLVRAFAEDNMDLDRDDLGDKLVEDLQQHFHDAFVDPTWPACPRHRNHPLWYKDGSWWCEQDDVAISALGELTATQRAR
jgi:hypothetical protein